ncbi:hypothetical protein TNCV_2711781 [Trichonephila clavipes]|nr:hypothetical protein TNCV_2711781 [Trichonephila clavipes]
MATGSYLTPNHSRSQSEIQGDLHNSTSLAMGNLVTRASDSRPEGLVPCLNCGGGDRRCRHLSSLWEFLRAKSYCHLHGAQG